MSLSKDHKNEKNDDFSIDLSKERLWLVNVETLKLSKKSWKTYKGALKNATPTDMIVTIDGYAWMLRHPEIDRSKRIKK